MLSTVGEVVPELLQVLFFGSVGVSLSVGGAYVERFAFDMLRSGDTVLAAWGAVLGAVLLGFAYIVVRDSLAPILRDLREGARN
ncbi:hypothetical protein [Halorubellus litoreus]|uniref:DUF8151 domain-containing protein n=1 Tax=Halorubellus litoreus TaxID=755308 RepID=A0ABD5VNK6_9EURY